MHSYTTMPQAVDSRGKDLAGLCCRERRRPPLTQLGSPAPLDPGVLLEQLKALGDETRLTIFKLLERRELCVCQIVPAVGLSQPTVSVHLGKLKRAGLVRERRSGQWSYYSADREGIRRFRETLDTFLAAELEAVAGLAALAARLPQRICPD
jgi:ArsR family transcriptional regulator